ncbi:MAG: hypothetical protein ACI9FJ_002401 [Alteromonadaceae bacterium]|jgi:hypothetical protein
MFKLASMTDMYYYSYIFSHTLTLANCWLFNSIVLANHLILMHYFLFQRSFSELFLALMRDSGGEMSMIVDERWISPY